MLVKKTAVLVFAAAAFMFIYPFSAMAGAKGAPAAVTRLAVKSTSVTMYVGEKYDIKVSVTPSKSAVKYSAANKKIASVSSAGLVKAVKAGKTYITVKSGKKSQKVSINVKKPVAVTKVNFPKPIKDMAVGQKANLFVVVQPGGATYKELTWTTSNKKILSISKKGDITAVSSGTASIKAVAHNGKYALLAIKVNAKPSKAAPIKGMSFTNASISIATGKQKVLSPAFEPANAASKELKWTSSNANIVSVDQAGRVTGVKLGTANITAASIADPTKKAVCKVTVKSFYRALLIGNEYVKSSRLYGPFNDVAAVRTILLGTANGESFNISFSASNIVVKKDATTKQINSAIDTLAATAGKDDVTYFYYSGHGASGGSITYICPTDGYISVDELSESLGKIPGKVVVLLDSCYSGGFISRGYSVASNSAELKSANGSVIEAFKPTLQINYRGDLTTVNGKFYVMTASSKANTSLTFYQPSDPEASAFGLFTRLLTQSASGKPPTADNNHDNRVSLSESSQYISNQMKMNYSEFLPKNNVQHYPTNSGFPLFSFKN